MYHLNLHKRILRILRPNPSCVALCTHLESISTWGTRAVVATLVQCANPSPQRYKHLKFVQVDSYGLGLQKNTIILILALAKLITL